MIQQTANPSSITEAATAAATPCPEICEQTQNTGECPAGDQILPNILSYHLKARYQNSPN